MKARLVRPHVCVHLGDGASYLYMKVVKSEIN